MKKHHNFPDKEYLLTCTPYRGTLIKTVILSSLAKKQLRKLPYHVVILFQNWEEDVKKRGLDEVRKIPGYHDEPLNGRLKGLRSIRLTKSYRAYYRVQGNEVNFINVERIDKHEY